MQDDFSADDQIGRPTLFHRYLRSVSYTHLQVSEEDSHNEEDVIFDEDGEIDDEATLELAQTDFRPDDFDEFDDDDVLKTIF